MLIGLSATCQKLMGVAELKRLFKSLATGVFNSTTRPIPGDFVIWDIMTTLHSLSDQPLTLEAISTMLFSSLMPFVSTTTARTLIVIADKESRKPTEKALEQRSRDSRSMVEPYPDDMVITPRGLIIKGVEMPQFSATRVMRTRPRRKELLREITRLFAKDPHICIPNGFVGTVILDMVDGDRPVCVTSPNLPQAVPEWLQSVGEFGEGDIGMLLYMRAIRNSPSTPRTAKYSLVTADSDVLPIFFGEFQGNPTLKGDWVGYRNEWCDMRVLVDKLIKKGWSKLGCLLTASLGGCDFIAKAQLTHSINFETVAASVIKTIKKGNNPLGSFESFDQLLVSVYTSWISAKLKGKGTKIPNRCDWDWVKDALASIPGGCKLRPPIDPETRWAAYETTKWLKSYWAARESV